MNKGDVIRVLDLQIQHYAKRQMTWFKKDKRIRWYKPEDATKISELVKKFV